MKRNLPLFAHLAMIFGGILSIIAAFIPTTIGYMKTSMLGMIKISAEMVDFAPGTAIFTIVMVSMFFVFTALTILFGALNKPIPVIIFDILAIIVFSLFGGIEGIVVPIFYISALIALAGAIILIAAKSISKKETIVTE